LLNALIIEGYYKLNISYGTYKVTGYDKEAYDKGDRTKITKTYNMDLPHYWGIILKLRF
jgi:hypothetical protein